MRLQHFAVAQVHVNAARQTRIEAAHGSHYIDPFEFIGTVFFEDWSVLHRVLVRSGSAINIAWIGIPGCWRIRMIVRDLTFFDDDVMRKYAAHCLVEAATNGFFRHFEIRPGLGVTGVQFA